MPEFVITHPPSGFVTVRQILESGNSNTQARSTQLNVAKAAADEADGVMVEGARSVPHRAEPK